MSARNGDKSRYHRERKQKIARRKRTRELLQPVATAPNDLKTSSAKTPRPVTA